MKKQKAAFSIIEIIIGIFIFSLGISSIYMIISSSMSTNIYNKNQIIAGNLAREGIELVRNIRDSNYITYHKWDQKGPHLNYDNSDNFFSENNYYKIENDYTSTEFPIIVENLTNFKEGAGELANMEDYRLCLDSKNRYTYVCTAASLNTKTPFYRYIYFDKVEYTDGSPKVVENALKVKSKVIWTVKGYHELEINTIIADWKRL